MRWSWSSTGLILCTRCLPQHGNSLSHIARLIDEYVIESLGERVLAAACEYGALTSELDFLLSRTTSKWSEVVKAAARGDHLHVFRRMRERQDGRGPWRADFYSVLDEVARYGHLEIVKWLYERDLSCIKGSALIAAACHGHLAVLKWLYEHTTDNLASGIDGGMDIAAGRGHLATVQWLYENFTNVDASYAMAGAARKGGLVMLQWLHTHYSDRFSSSVMDIAASERHLEMVQWLHEHRSEGCASHAMDAAANDGHFEVVRWLHDNRSEGCTAGVVDYAAEAGHLDIVKWLHENRSEECTETALYYAARDGHAELLRWLVEHYPDKCSEDLMEIAVWEGHLDIVQYLHENTNQRASRWGLGAAAGQGWLKTLQLLIQYYYGDDGVVGWDGLNAVSKAFDKVLTQLPCEDAASSLWGEALESLERFHSCGFYSCASVMLERALRRGCRTLAQQFIVHRDGREICQYVAVAAKRESIVLLRWLLANGTPIDKSSAIQLATKHSFAEYVEVAGYLSEDDRVQLICRAVTTKCWRKLLLWTLENTSFNDSSRATIYNTIKQSPSDTEKWLRENLTNAETRKWCF